MTAPSDGKLTQKNLALWAVPHMQQCPGDRLRSVMSSIIRRRSGLTAGVASAMGWSPDLRLVSATKPSHQQAIPANSLNHPASAGSFNPNDSNFYRNALVTWDNITLYNLDSIGPAQLIHRRINWVSCMCFSRLFTHQRWFIRDIGVSRCKSTFTLF